MNMTISGSTRRAEYAPSDFSLLEINQSIPSSWDRVFAGWDRSGIVPDFTVAIHHPGGDVMKFARDNQSPDKINYSNPLYVWEIKDNYGGWDLGITEPGSSGSPLFDHNGRIIGQEVGGQSACSLTASTTDNGLGDWFGRMDTNWTGGGQSVSRASDWLDPNGTEVLIMNAYPSVLTMDLSIVSIDSPTGTAEFTDNELVTITIQNGGNESISNFNLSVQVDGGDTITETYSGTLNPGESDQYTYVQSFDLSTVGPHEITVTGILDGDELSSNNSLTVTINTLGEVECLELYSLPYLNDFNDAESFTSCNTFVDSDGDGNGWTSVAFSIDNGNRVADSQSYNGSALSPDNWLIMGPIDLTNAGDTTLTWLVRGIDPSYCGENYSVYISDSNDIASFTSSGLYYDETISSGSDACGNTFAERSLDISSAAGQQIYIGFRHYDITDMFRLNIDDVRVEGEEMGVNDFDNLNINYFFNQLTRELEISSTEIIKNIQIVNLLGQSIMTDNINDLTYKINLANLSSSIYVVNVEGISGMKTFKLQIN
jgi:hypothetical protein